MKPTCRVNAGCLVAIQSAGGGTGAGTEPGTRCAWRRCSARRSPPIRVCARSSFSACRPTFGSATSKSTVSPPSRRLPPRSFSRMCLRRRSPWAGSRFSPRQKTPMTPQFGSSSGSRPRDAATPALTRGSFESQARLRRRSSACGMTVNEALFERRAAAGRFCTLAVTTADLETRLRETTARVREGAAAAEAAAIEATLLEIASGGRTASQSRRGARAPGTSPGTRLTPTRSSSLTSASPSHRPERAAGCPARARAIRTRTRSGARQQDLTAALSACRCPGSGASVRAGAQHHRRPVRGLRAGGCSVVVESVTWGTAAAGRSAALQQGIVAAEETAFTDGLRRSIQTDLATIDRLQSALTPDERTTRCAKASTAPDCVFRRASTASDTLDRTLRRS